MHRGYVTVHRKILDNPIVFKDADHIAVWIYLMLNATHKNYRALFNGRSVTLLPGQLITGRLSIAKKLKINDSKVKRILNLFKNEQLIDQRATNQNSLITLVSWGKYQKSDQQCDQQVTNERPTGDQRVTTNKNIKNENNVETQKNLFPAEPEKKPAGKKVNGWAIWVDINRQRNRVDPIPAGPDTKAAKFLTDSIDGIQTVKDIMRLFLDDDDPFLQRSGHALRHITGRVNAYLNLADQMFGGGDADDISDILAIEEQIAKREAEERERKQNGNIKGSASSG